MSALTLSPSAAAPSSTAGRPRSAHRTVPAQPVAARSRSRAARLEITRRGRLVVTTVVFLLALALAGLAVAGVDVPAALAGSAQGTVRVTVLPGDTLSGYAEQYAPAGTDPRDYVLLVQRTNNLSSERIVAGTTLDLPVGEDARP